MKPKIGHLYGVKYSSSRTGHQYTLLVINLSKDLIVCEKTRLSETGIVVLTDIQFNELNDAFRLDYLGEATE